MATIPELDKFDYSLLNLLQTDNKISLRELGERINLSTAAVQRRIRRLEELGVIQANIAVLNTDLLGKPVTIIVEVHAESTRSMDLDALKKAFEVPEVQQCYYVTGEADFILVITVANMSDYEALSQRLFHDNKNVKWFRSMIAMERIRVGLNMPLPC